MFEPIMINLEYFESLKSKVLDGFEQQSNNRKIQNNEQNQMNYQIYKHIDTSSRSCSVAEIMKSFSNPAFVKLDASEQKNWKKLRDEMTKKIGEYSDALRKYEQSGGKTPEEPQVINENRNTEFTHVATISTAFKNVQRVPQEKAAKLFQVKDINDAKVGHTIHLKNTDNDVKVTLLGRNSHDYHDASLAIKDKKDFDWAKSSIYDGKTNFEEGKGMIDA